MLSEIAYGSLGYIAGCLLGLIPGMHINNIVPLVTSMQLNPILASIFLVSSLVTYNFFGFLRMSITSMPTEETVLGIHPVRRMILRGLGTEAMRLYAFGSLVSSFFFLTFLPAIIFLLDFIYYTTKPITPFILILIVLLLILRERKLKKIALAAIIFLASGLLGVYSFVLNLNNPFLHLLSGMFGIGFVASNLSTPKLPKQTTPLKLILPFKSKIKATLLGFLSSFTMALIPSVSSSQATMLSNLLTKADEKEFIVSLGAVVNFDVLFSLTSLYLLNKSRNGVIEGVKSILTLDAKTYIAFLLLVSLISFLAYLTLTSTSKKLFKLLSGRNLKPLYVASIVFIVALSLYFDGLLGLSVLLPSAYLGYITAKKEVSNVHLLGCLNLVTILLLLGVL